MQEYRTTNWWAKYYLITSIIFALLYFFVLPKIRYPPSIYARLAGLIIFPGLGSLMFFHLKAKKFSIENDQLIFTQTFLSSLIPSVNKIINIKDIQTIRHLQILNDRKSLSDGDNRIGDIIIYYIIDGIKQEIKFPSHEFENKTLHSMIVKIMKINPNIKLDERILPYLSK